MEMFVVAAAAGFYMFNLPHVHPCQMALPVRWEIIFAHHLHQVDNGPWAAAGCHSCLDMAETMGFVMGSVGLGWPCLGSAPTVPTESLRWVWGEGELFTEVL